MNNSLRNARMPGDLRLTRLAFHALLLSAVAGAATSASAQTQALQEFVPAAYPVNSSIPYSPSAKNSIARGPDGNVWFTFTNSSGGYIGQMNAQTQQVTVLGPLDGSPVLLTQGPPADYFSIWFVEVVINADQSQTWELGRISTVQANPANPTGCLNNVAPCITLGTPAAPGAPIPYTNQSILPNGITPLPNAMISSPNSPGAAPDGGVVVPDSGNNQDNGIYITDSNNNILWRANIVQINPTMASQLNWMSSIPTAAPTYGVTWGPDNYLWCTEYEPTDGEGTLGYLERIPFPSASAQVTGAQIARTTFTLPAPVIPGSFDAMAPGPDGLSVWFSQGNGTMIDSLATDSLTSDNHNYTFGQYTLSVLANSTNSITLNDMTLGPDFALWFTQQGASASSLGRLSVNAPGAAPVYTAEALPNGAFSQPYSITVGPNNNDLWFTDSALAVLGDAVIIPRLTIQNSATLPNAVIGTSYSTPLTVTGGNAPYSYLPLSSTAPPWLSVNVTGSLNGTVAGPPAINPPDTFPASVMDTTPAFAPTFPNFVQTATQQFSLTVTALLTVNPMALPSAIAGTVYPSTQLTSTGGAGSYTWSLGQGSPQPPAGLTLSPAGVISGQLSPNAASATIFVTVSDNEVPPQTSAAQLFPITIVPVLSIVTPTTLPSGAIGSNYSKQLQAQGGTGAYTWTLAAGSTLPANLTLTSGGLISGPLTGLTSTTRFTVNLSDPGPPAQAVSQTFSITTVAGSPASITATSGRGQSAEVNHAFGSPLTATVKDGSGNLVSLASVTFSAPTSGASGTFAVGHLTAVVQTNSSGVATSPVFTANATAGGPYNVTATVAGITSSASFALTNIVGPPGSITATSGGGQSSLVGVVFANPFVATVKDSSGNLISGASVTFSAPTSNASGTFAGGQLTAVVQTNSSGVATSPIFTANAIAGSYNVTATATGVASPAYFALRNTAVVAPPPVFTLTGLPSSPQPGASISSATVTSSAAFTGTLTVALSSTISGFPPNNNGDAGFETGSTVFGAKPATASVSVPAGTTTVTFPAPLDPGTVAGSLAVTLAAGTQTSASTVKIEPLAPIIEANSVQIVPVGSTGFDVELVATSTTLDLTTATFTFTAAQGAQISGDSTFTKDVSSLLPGWFATAGNYQYGGAFSLSIPFTISGPISAIQSVSVTLNNSVGPSSAVSGTQ